jgi:Ca2+-binding RTX toxin-like protein
VAVTGETDSGGGSFPDGTGFGTLSGPDTTFNGARDAFVAKVRADGSGLSWAGYIGGVSLDQGFGVAFGTDGVVHVVGATSSTQATFPDGNGFGALDGPDTTYNDDDTLDGFVATVGEPKCPGYEGVAGNHVVGSAGADVLQGTAGADIICGLGGADTLTGMAGNDILIGGTGNDTLVPGAGADENLGGMGTDTVVFAATGAAVTANLSTGTAPGQGSDSLSAVENLTGTSKGDSLTGGSTANVLKGLGGVDVLKGLAGNDTLNGGLGNDTLNGGTGTDTCIAGGGTDAKTSCEA